MSVKAGTKSTNEYELAKNPKTGKVIKDPKTGKPAKIIIRK